MDYYYYLTKRDEPRDEENSILLQYKGMHRESKNKKSMNYSHSYVVNEYSRNQRLRAYRHDIYPVIIALFETSNCKSKSFVSTHL